MGRPGISGFWQPERESGDPKGAELKSSVPHGHFPAWPHCFSCETSVQLLVTTLLQTRMILARKITFPSFPREKSPKASGGWGMVCAAVALRALTAVHLGALHRGLALGHRRAQQGNRDSGAG